MVENMEIAVKQLQRRYYEIILFMALLRGCAQINDSFSGIVLLVPILWSTGTGADVMIPITVPLIGERSLLPFMYY
jgi:Cu/Ag efflux pump CusA